LDEFHWGEELLILGTCIAIFFIGKAMIGLGIITYGYGFALGGVVPLMMAGSGAMMAGLCLLRGAWDGAMNSGKNAGRRYYANR